MQYYCLIIFKLVRKIKKINKEDANQRYELSYDKVKEILANIELCSVVQLKRGNEEELVLSPSDKFHREETTTVENSVNSNATCVNRARFSI